MGENSLTYEDILYVNMIILDYKTEQSRKFNSE